MKSFLKPLVFVVYAGVILGCKAGSTPKEAFNAWIKAMEKCDSQAIKGGITNESITQIDKATGQIKALLPPEQAKDFDFFKEICKDFKPTEITITDENINGEIAILTSKIKGKEEKIKMKKEDGVWKIDLAEVMRGAMQALPKDEPPTP